MKAFLRVALPAAAVTCIEWWAFEILSLIVGLLPNAEVNLAAHATVFNILVILYMSFTGLGNALCAMTGKAVGGRAAHAVPTLIIIAMLISTAFTAAVCALMYFGRTYLSTLFTDDEAVQRVIHATIPAVCLSVPAYATLMTLFGACRGANKQAVAAAGTGVGYALGIPLGYVLGVQLHWPLPLSGIWIGNAAALAIGAATAIAVVSTVNWSKCEPASAIGCKLPFLEPDANLGLVANGLPSAQNSGLRAQNSGMHAQDSGMHAQDSGMHAQDSRMHAQALDDAGTAPLVMRPRSLGRE